MSASTERWWIEADGRVWGPYPAGRLAQFRDEGRLGAGSLMARDPAGPFAPAALQPALAGLFDGLQDDVSAAEAPTETVATAPSPRPLLVVTDAPDAVHDGLEAALGGHGEVVRVRPGLWLVRAREGPAALRNALSRRLRGEAMLLVVEAPLSLAAWFNLDGATDSALRRLWTG